MSKCTQCRYIIPHYFLRVIPIPKIIIKAQELRMLIDESLVLSENKINKEHSKSVEELFGSIGNMNKLLSIKSRYYVGSGHGKVAEDHGAVCCDCDSGLKIWFSANVLNSTITAIMRNTQIIAFGK